MCAKKWRERKDYCRHKIDVDPGRQARYDAESGADEHCDKNLKNHKNKKEENLKYLSQTSLRLERLCLSLFVVSHKFGDSDCQPGERNNPRAECVQLRHAD